MDVLLDVDTIVDIQVSSDELTAVLGNLKGIVEKKTTLPILANVLIQTLNNSEISITASDMDIVANRIFSADVKKKGKLAIPAITFYEIVKTLKAGSIVNIVLKNNAEGKHTIEISSGKYLIRLPYISPENFPIVTLEDYTSSFEISAKDLKQLIDKTKFAVSTEETRFYLNGIYFHVSDNNKLCAVSTDLHRLAKSEIDAPSGSENLKTGVIIPLKAVAELNKLLDNVNGLVSIKASPTKISFEFDKTTLVTKLIDGVFPEYQAAIPASSPIKVSIDKQVLEHSVALVSISAPEKTKSIKFGFAENCLVLSTTSDISGNAKEEIEIEYKAETLDISFNAKYVLDILRVIEGKTVDLHLTDSFSAMMITDTEGGGELYIVMPTRG